MGHCPVKCNIFPASIQWNKPSRKLLYFLISVSVTTGIVLLTYSNAFNAVNTPAGNVQVGASPDSTRLLCNTTTTAVTLMEKYELISEEQSEDFLILKSGNWLLDKGEISFSDVVLDDSIYFLETSGQPFLSPKQLCAIESTAAHNPNRSILISVTSTNLLATAATTGLVHAHPNIRFLHLNISEWLNGTVLATWLQKGLLEKSDYRVAHTSDVLRCATLFKHGGTYLDLDVIVLKPLDSLMNTIGLEALGDDALANGAVMAFERGHPIMETCLEELLERFDGDNWASNGPDLLTRVLKAWCNASQQEGKPALEPGLCRNVDILNTKAFYPIHYSAWKSLFDDNNITSAEVLQNFDDSFLIHYWNKLSAHVPIIPGSQQTLGILADRHCPIIARAHRQGLWGLHA